jgi:hypothetical protein
MPPKNALPAAAVEELVKWVAMGAPMPQDTTAKARKRGYDWQKATQFWSYVPPVAAPTPKANDGAAMLDPIDHFVAAKRKQAGLPPAPTADKATLLRRVTFDLTGLPPTPEELDTFLADKSPSAYDKVVDRLLQSPQFGERWGRYWLDVARYGEDQAYAFDQKPLTQAWRYRDWVVNAFNQDLPYDEFIRRQLAADLIPDLPKSELAATGLIAIGPMYFKRTEVQKALADELDDRIDVVTRGTMGLTVACARCHDHKFDPIPTADYYALAGIFKSTRIADRYLADDATVAAYHRELYSRPLLQERLQALRLQAWRGLAVTNELHAALSSDNASAVSWDLRKWLKQKPNKSTPSELRKLHTPSSSGEARIVDDAEGKKMGTWKHSTFYKGFHGKGYLHDGNQAKGKRSIKFDLPVAAAGKYRLFLGYNHNDQRATKVPITVAHAAGTSKATINQQQPPQVDGRWTAIGTYHFDPAKPASLTVSNAGTKGFVIVDGIRMVRVGLADSNAGPAKRDVEAVGTRITELLAKLPKHVPAPIFSTDVVSSKNPDHRAPVEVELNGARELHLVTWNESTNRYAFNFNAWLNPTVRSTKDVAKLTDLEPVTRKAIDGELIGAKYDRHDDAIIVHGEVLVHGIQNVGTTHYHYRLPEGEFARFTAEAGIFNKNGGGVNHNKARFLVFTESPEAWLQQQEVLAELRRYLGNDLILSDAALAALLPAEQNKELKRIRTSLNSSRLSRPEVVHSLWEGEVRDHAILVRGSPKKLGDTVPRGFLTILGKDAKIGSRPDFPEGSGRLALAEAIVDRNNPLTARVMANRVWHHLFGAGLVRTPSNFGELGERPTHPELLDHLALRFMDSGWSVKQLIRSIVRTGTYQLASSAVKDNQEKDPENRLLWRQNLRRLDLESYRDAMLAVSGSLDTRIGGRSVGSSLESTSNNRRSLYAKVSRTNPDKTGLTFDFPSANSSAAMRAVTTVPQQKLFSLNSPFVRSQADRLAKRLASVKETDAKLDHAFRLLYGRSPTDSETPGLRQFAESANGDPWPQIAQILLISNEFQYLD